MTDRVRTITLAGELNGSLCEHGPGGSFVPFELVFSGVMAHRVIELDSWDWESDSSFDEVLDSQWVAQLGGKVTRAHRHFLVQAYDEVIEVVCELFRFQGGARGTWS